MNSVPIEWNIKDDGLKERVILVTGAGSGIGAAVALACAQHGATVILTGKRTKPLEACYDAIKACGAAEPMMVPLDLLRSGPEQCVEMARQLRDEFGRLDGLIHNAAHFPGLMPFELIDPKRWYQDLQVNLSAPFLLSQALMPLLRQSPAARLVFTLENLQQVGRAHWGAYGASKFGLEGLFRITADEFEGSTVTVCGVNPGPTRTTLRARAWAAEDADEVTPPEERVQPYLYCMDPDETPVPGAVFSA